MPVTHQIPTARDGEGQQQAYLAVELPPLNEAEQHRLEQLRQHVQLHTHTHDLRDFAAAARQVLGQGYDVGTGAAHVWMVRQGEKERLAIIADRYTTAFREWNAPQLRPLDTDNAGIL